MVHSGAQLYCFSYQQLCYDMYMKINLITHNNQVLVKYLLLFQFRHNNGNNAAILFSIYNYYFFIKFLGCKGGTMRSKV